MPFCARGASWTLGGSSGGQKNRGTPPPPKRPHAHLVSRRGRTFCRHHPPPPNLPRIHLAVGPVEERACCWKPAPPPPPPSPLFGEGRVMGEWPSRDISSTHPSIPLERRLRFLPSCGAHVRVHRVPASLNAWRRGRSAPAHSIQRGSSPLLGRQSTGSKGQKRWRERGGAGDDRAC